MVQCKEDISKFETNISDMQDRCRKITEIQDAMGGLKKLIDRQNYKLSQKVSMDDYERYNRTIATQEQCEKMIRQLDMLELSYKQSIVVLSESLSLHQNRPDVTL